jgi:plastocyanin
MQRALLRRFPVAGLGLLAAAVFTACSGSKAATTTSPPSTAPAASSAIAPSARVSVVSDAATIGAFSPPTVTVSAGQSVEWIFQDANPHTVTADDGSFTSTKAGLANSKTFSHTFATAGTYKYHCYIHPQMLGTVVVQ